MSTAHEFVELDPGGYPVQFEFRGRHRVARWRPLLHWFLAAPHLLVLYLLLPVAAALVAISLVAVVATKRVPEGIHGMLAMNLRYQVRVATFLFALGDTYPPFRFDATGEDPGDDPNVSVDVPDPGDRQRWAPLYSWLLAVPHYVALLVIGAAVLLATVGAWLAVVVTGRYPASIRRLFVRYARYAVRVLAHVGLLRDEYPPFRLA